MKQPIIQVDINESGEINHVFGDLRLYGPLAGRVAAPALDLVLAHTRSENLLPNGEPAGMKKSLDEQPVVWFLDAYGTGNLYLLRRLSPGVKIGIRVHQEADRAGLKNQQVSIDFTTDEGPEIFEDVLKEVSGAPDLARCLITFTGRVEDPAYVCDTAEVARAVGSLRREREALFAALRSNPLPEEETGEEEDENYPAT